MKVVLAYSGGLDTSVILAWLRETYDADVVACESAIGDAIDLSSLVLFHCLLIGQPRSDSIRRSTDSARCFA